MIQINKVTKTYEMGSQSVQVLKGIDLKIEEGDFVAIMGPSGSGKSTLMHILGLLDVPTTGSYLLNGREVSGLSEDELAVVRRNEIGFIFQQFNLLPRLEAWQNVTLPLTYSASGFDKNIGEDLLKRVGLGDRISHKTNELSGGQQQRIAIARSLVNNPNIIFADEPTGNLDSNSEKEIMDILHLLNDNGITIILVTHEEEIGNQAKRLIRLKDGEIVSDQRLKDIAGDTLYRNKSELHIQIGNTLQSSVQRSLIEKNNSKLGSSGVFSEIYGHVINGFKTLLSNKIRSALSMLGILIGVASVIGMLALGAGAQKSIEKQLSSLGSNLLVLRAGSARVGGVMQESGTRMKIYPADSSALKSKIAQIKDISASLSGRGQVTFQNKNWNTSIMGVDVAFQKIRASKPVFGRFFTDYENQSRALVAVIGVTVAKELFGGKSPIGELIKVNKINFRIVGVLPAKGTAGPQDQDDRVVIPVMTAMYRVFGKNYVDSLDIEVVDVERMEETQTEIISFMNMRNKVPVSAQEDAFNIFNMSDIQKALNSSTETMTLLLSFVAAISLVVGGIGIMNIMLVSVTERTKEIGLRKSIGARRRDILLQFMAESIVISLSGGVAGIILGWFFSICISSILGWNTVISILSIIISFFFSIFIGVLFGSYPAAKASKLHPIQALRYE